MPKQTIKDLNVDSKTVLVRVDYNVPMQNGEISNDNRIIASLPTLKYLIEHGAKIVLFSHMGKIKSEEDKAENDLQPVANRLSELLDISVQFSPETRGKALEEKVHGLQSGDVLLVQNTRFEDLDGKKESKNDPELGKYWASLGDIYVNDAFGTTHREHASNVGIASHLDSGIGFLVEKELAYLGEAVDQPDRPFIAILGGAKVSDKIKVIENLIDKADKIIIGGGMAYTFFKAQGLEIGKSIVENERLELAQSVLKKAGDKIILPVDTVVADEFSNTANTKIVEVDEIPSDWEGLDIGPKTIEIFSDTLSKAKTVVWNGPMGVFEMEKFAKGTNGLAKTLADLKGKATTIVGGGDSAAAIYQLGFEEDFSHISTGGGASLQYLEGQSLPGVEAIKDK